MGLLLRDYFFDEKKECLDPIAVYALNGFTQLALSQWRYASNISLTLCCIYLHWRKDVVLAQRSTRGFSIITLKSLKQVQHVSLGSN